ncbi:hypothetical protein C3L33_11229, partial [Rhododendron williamsianum]
MITRSNLAEQLREYQIRSKYDWTSFSVFSSTSNLHFSRYPLFNRPLIVSIAPTSDIFLSCIFLFHECRVDVVIFVLWELIILAFLVFSAVSLYFGHVKIAFILVCITLLLLLCMKITKQVRLDRKKKRRMLLPLSM